MNKNIYEAVIWKTFFIIHLTNFITFILNTVFKENV